ncbi:MAG TPA: hypothetical protein VMV88_03140 [Gallionella sp.]|nr:hypothetical protein [Gallionella sp.]
MATTVLSIGPFRDVHSIDIFSRKGRKFTVDIYKNKDGFESDVTIIDRVSSVPGSWIFHTEPTSTAASDNFEACIKLINDYLLKVDPQDHIFDVHNPCNCPFLDKPGQERVLSGKGITCPVRVN